QATSFASIDTDTGTYTTITSNLLSGTTLANLAYDPLLKRFYTSTGVNTTSDLRTVTTSGSLSPAIGSIGKNLGAMWYRTVEPYTSGTLGVYNRTNTEVGRVNTTTGAYTSGSNSNANFNNLVGGRGAILGNANYMVSPNANATAANSAFGTMNLLTGAFTTLATGTTFQHMVLASDGAELYGLVPVSTGTALLYKVTTTGSLTQVAEVKPASGVLPLQFSGAAFAVPEPTAIGLAVSGVAALAVGVRSRRRKR
ncbi:MAG: PEP-CTERM sorting domain-containing protein, partial [Planctomycetaceae bacterium]